MKLCLAQDPAADALLDDDPFALLVGMLLDQQVPFETAFAGPKKIADRMGGLDVGEIADYDPDKFAALCAERPAVHRFPGSMAKRIQALARIIVDRYDGNAAGLWTAGEPDGQEVLRRLKALPGDSPAQQPLTQAVLEIANLVTKVQVQEDSPPLSPEPVPVTDEKHRARNKPIMTAGTGP